MRFLLFFLVLAAPMHSLTVERAATGSEADESSCAIARPEDSFPATRDQVYFRFLARGLRAGDKLAVEWLEPSGQVHSSSEYNDLPQAPSLCFLTGLPVGGFPAGELPGTWTVRVVAGARTLAWRRFDITGAPGQGGPRVVRVQQETAGSQTELLLTGAGIVSDSVVHVAQYTKSGGWSYIAALLPQPAEGGRMAVRLPELAAAEYLVIVRNPDGRQSSPVRFLVSSSGGYRLPTPAGVPWVITQRPYGGFSHYGRSRHAWDIAPSGSACLVAMRPGIAFTFDRGWKQTPHRRIFGNYITIQHDDGEFSHYAHLQTGTFRVKNGQRVEQGQPLATAGNSGYTVGQGGGRHVHVHVTRAFPISSPSIPFRFEDLPDNAARRAKTTVISSNNIPAGDCSRQSGGASYSGMVAVTEAWTQPLAVARGSRALGVSLGWDAAGHELDLSLVSPSGRLHAVYGDSTGFRSGGREIQLENPEPGTWLLCVRGMKGGGERVGFHAEAHIQ